MGNTATAQRGRVDVEQRSVVVENVAEYRPAERLVPFEELGPRYGITFNRVYLYRLMRQGRFPLSVKLMEGGRAAWIESEIIAWIRSRPRAITVSASAVEIRTRGRGKVSK